MGNKKGGWQVHLPQKRLEKKRIDAKINDIIVGPRESVCGLTGYAGRTEARYRCARCGNYHKTGELHDQATHATHATPASQ